ncbi:hypothetical protein Baya_6325 [Bagarius yarrelli]|uniref:Uncharacterized protein n=1 Tax=Bagarius yarrelli TaxID=175774 RepID=A0A556TXZ1_BAGYA|nr:hypothetical protein Baya_6325 [Bagarius yarrelli]
MKTAEASISLQTKKLGPPGETLQELLHGQRARGLLTGEECQGILVNEQHMAELDPKLTLVINALSPPSLHSELQLCLHVYSSPIQTST